MLEHGLDHVHASRPWVRPMGSLDSRGHESGLWRFDDSPARAKAARATNSRHQHTVGPTISGFRQNQNNNFETSLSSPSLCLAGDYASPV
jgi:hypothetical protein